VYTTKKLKKCVFQFVFYSLDSKQNICCGGEKMKRFTILVLSLLVTMSMVLAACAPKDTPVVEEPTEEPMVEEPEVEEPEVEEPTEEATEEVEEPEEEMYPEQPFGENLPMEPTIDTPLVVTYTEFSQKFSPFFSESGYDADVAAMTQIGLLTTDRVGGIINNAIEGETREYNGTPYEYKGAADTSVVYDEETDTTKYTAKLRVGMKFSDGEPVTADDVIFTYYTFLDPSYVGTTSLYSFDIVGLKDYQTQTTTEVFDKYDALFDEIYAAGADHEWTEDDAWTMEQQEDFWARVDEAVLREAQKIVDSQC
jgi:ABC-type transport system substrate-binding protein